MVTRRRCAAGCWLLLGRFRGCLAAAATPRCTRWAVMRCRCAAAVAAAVRFTSIELTSRIGKRRHNRWYENVFGQRRQRIVRAAARHLCGARRLLFAGHFLGLVFCVRRKASRRYRRCGRQCVVALVWRCGMWNRRCRMKPTVGAVVSVADGAFVYVVVGGGNSVVVIARFRRR